MTTLPPNILKFCHEMEQTRYPIYLTPLEMRIISQVLLAANECVSEAVSSMQESIELGTMDGQTREQYKFMQIHAKYLKHMGGLLAGFAMDHKEKAEARCQIEL